MQDYRNLIREIIAGDDAAFDELYIAVYPRALRIAKRYARSRSEAEDLVQDAFLSLWERRGALSVDEQVDLYVITAIRNRALNVIRHGRYVRNAEDVSYDSMDHLPPGFGSSSVSPSQDIDLNDMESAIECAVSALPEIQRRVITFRWRTQMSYDAIAAELGIGVKAVRLNLERAYNTLRPLLEPLIKE